jgi:hypothetical protein
MSEVVSPVMPLQYLDGEDRLCLWLSEKPGWPERLPAVEFSEEELAEIERVFEAYHKMQQMLMERFRFRENGYV